MRKILCSMGIHKWRKTTFSEWSGFAHNIFDNIPGFECKYCGAQKLGGVFKDVKSIKGRWVEVCICNECGKVYEGVTLPTVCEKCGTKGVYKVGNHTTRIARKTIFGFEFKEGR